MRKIKEGGVRHFLFMETTKIADKIKNREEGMVKIQMGGGGGSVPFYVPHPKPGRIKFLVEIIGNNNL